MQLPGWDVRYVSLYTYEYILHNWLSEIEW
jgi:hypothetical protein